MEIFRPSAQSMVKTAVLPIFRGCASRMMQFLPKKGYFGLGKPWKAMILRRVFSAVSVLGARRDMDLSSFLVKVASCSSWEIGAGRLFRFSTSQFAPVSERDL